MSNFDNPSVEVEEQVAALRAAADPDAHGRERSRRLRLSVLSGVLLKPLALLTPLVTTPLFLKYLGDEGYGLFQTVLGLSVLLSLSNAGLQLGLMNRLIDCHVSGDRVAARRYISSLTITLAVILTVAAVLWTIATYVVDWASFFKVSDPQIAAATPWIVWITGIATLAGLLFGLPITIYFAYQETVRVYLWDGIARIATLLASIGVVYTHFGLIGVAVATAVTPVAVGGVNNLVLFAQRPWLRPRLMDFDRSIVRGTLGDGFYMFLLQMAVIALFQCDKLIIGSNISAKAVTPYALLGQVFVMAYGAFMVLLSPLWPAHGEAYRRGDIPWIRRKVNFSLAVAFTLIVGCSVVLLGFGDTLFRLWTHGKVTHVPRTLILAMTALFLLRAWVDCRAVVLNPANILLPQVRFFLAHMGLNLILALALVKPFGVAGVAWATPIAALFTTAWGYPWLLNRALKERAATAAEQ